MTRLAVEMLLVALGVSTRLVNHAIPMVGRRIDRIELEGHIAGIDDVVIRPGRDNDRETGLYCRAYTIQKRLARPFLNTEN